MVEGRPQNDEFTGGIRISADKLYDLQSARAAFRARHAAGLQWRIERQPAARAAVSLHAGQLPGVDRLQQPKAPQCRIDLGDEWRVKLDDDLIQSLGAWLKPENVQILY